MALAPPVAAVYDYRRVTKTARSNLKSNSHGNKTSNKTPRLRSRFPFVKIRPIVVKEIPSVPDRH